MRAAIVLLLALLAALLPGSLSLSIRVQGVTPGEVRKLPTDQGYRSAGVWLSLVADSPMPVGDSGTFDVYCSVLSSGISSMTIRGVRWMGGMSVSQSSDLGRTTLDTYSVRYADCDFTWTTPPADATWAATALPQDIRFNIDVGEVGQPRGQVTPVLYSGGGPSEPIATGGTYSFGLTSQIAPAAGSGGARFDVQCFYLNSSNPFEQNSVLREMFTMPPLVFAEGQRQASTSWTAPSGRIFSPFRCLYIFRNDLPHDPLFERAVVGYAISNRLEWRPTMTLRGLPPFDTRSGTPKINIYSSSTKTRQMSIQLNDAPLAPVQVSAGCQNWFTTVFNFAAGQTTSNELTLPSASSATTGARCTFQVVNTLAGRDTDFDSLVAQSADLSVQQAPFLYLSSLTNGVYLSPNNPVYLPASMSSLTLEVRPQPAPMEGPVYVLMRCTKTAGTGTGAVATFDLSFTLPMGRTTTNSTLNPPRSATSSLTYSCTVAPATSGVAAGRDEDFDRALITPNSVELNIEASSGSTPGTTPGTTPGSDTPAQPTDPTTLVAFVISQSKSYLETVRSTLTDGLAAALNIASSRFFIDVQAVEEVPNTSVLAVYISGRADGNTLESTSASLAAELKRQVETNTSSLHAQPIFRDSVLTWIDLNGSAGARTTSILAGIVAVVLAFVAGSAL